MRLIPQLEAQRDQFIKDNGREPEVVLLNPYTAYMLAVEMSRYVTMQTADPSKLTFYGKPVRRTEDISKDEIEL